MCAIVPFFNRIAMLLAALLIPLSVHAKQEQLSVLSSIKPVHVLVLAVADGLVDAEQLIPDFASPHHYNFKPSELRKIGKADVIFRIDPTLEVMLNRLLLERAASIPVISLADAPGITFLPVSGKHPEDHAGEENQSQDQVAEVRAGDGDTLQDRQSNNMHIWTSPHNVRAMIRQISQTLSELDPQNRKQYEINSSAFIERLDQTVERLRLRLEPLKERPYLVFHNSWHYFAREFGLRDPIIASRQESVLPGAKTIPIIRKQIQSQSIHCLFTQPNMNKGWVKTLTENLGHIKVVEIDVTASRFNTTSSTYIDWLEYLGQQVVSCIGENPVAGQE